jgi:hypothetical protein
MPGIRFISIDKRDNTQPIPNFVNVAYPIPKRFACSVATSMIRVVRSVIGILPDALHDPAAKKYSCV